MIKVLKERFGEANQSDKYRQEIKAADAGQTRHSETSIRTSDGLPLLLFPSSITELVKQ